uniref:Uncharacterized protein n=1 Tax=Avena sativa TaxID=4498 RepID=A0ACD5YEW7_AVESA
MPANPEPFSKPCPPATSTSHAKTTTRPFISTVGCDNDDDDDFQIPPRASHARPLKPSNGAVSRHLRKKLQLPYPYSGKENRAVASGTASAGRVAAMAAAVAETLTAGSRDGTVVRRVPEGNGATGGGICGLLRSGSGDPNLGATEEKGLGGYDGCKGSSSCFPNSTESSVLEPGETCDLGGGQAKGVSGASNPVPGEGLMGGRSGSWRHGPACNEGDVDVEVDAKAEVASRSETEMNEWSGSGVHDGNYHSHSIESEILVSSSKYDFEGADCKDFQEPRLGIYSLASEERKVVAEDVATSNSDPAEKKSSSTADSVEYDCLNSVELESSKVHHFEADDCDDFEIGTQLNELINLCMDDQVDSHRNSKVSPVEENKMDSGRSESVYKVQCPLCGSDISDLSEELQLAHTNNCLDKDEPAKESDHNHERGPSTGENIESECVVEWLRNLGLSKYEEFFTKEEVDWETLQWLTEEDLLGMGITSLGPRKKIIHALGELRKKNDHTNDTEADVLISENTNRTKVPMKGNKLITEFFRCSSSDQKQRVRKVQRTSSLNNQKSSSAKVATSRNRTRKAKVKDTPVWCCIPGTPFRVDAFRFLRGDCCHWFLTHFHLDHYQGLTKNFCHGKIYCSSITANLVHHKIGVTWDRLHVLPLNKRVTVAGVNLTCFDANHCPGSIIILFEPSNGKAILHTGDFRFSSEMANNPVLQSSHIHTLILDTTYCNPRYDFPSQEIVIQFVIEAIQAEAFNPKTLFLIGSYTIGKERLFTEVARLLQKKIFVGAAKLQILKHLELPQEIMPWLTANEAESHIHVVPMWTLASFKRLKHLSSQYANRFDLIVAFCPTGWAFGKGRKKTPGRRWQQGTIIRYEVPYSEHSSFTELREFVRFISPEHIVPSVNNDGPESADAMLTQLLNDDS